jgi:FtsH-binding integral membrane protein
MMQGLIAVWIFILCMGALFGDETLRYVIPTVLAAFLAAGIVTIPIWMPIVLYNKHKRVKTKKQMVEIESFSERYA